jgi:hypothetical protein
MINNKKGITLFVLIVTMLVIILLIGNAILFVFISHPVKQDIVIKKFFGIYELKAIIMLCVSTLVVTLQEVIVITGTRVNQIVSWQQQLIEESKEVPLILTI